MSKPVSDEEKEIEAVRMVAWNSYDDFSKYAAAKILTLYDTVEAQERSLELLRKELERLKIALHTHESYDKTLSELHEENEQLRIQLEQQSEISNNFHQMSNKYLYEIEHLRVDVTRYKTALRKIVCLNIQMPDEVFSLANDALEGK